jgi:Fe-S-cluster-containing hydrogenase component 2
MIDKERMSMAYFDPRIVVYEDVNQCADQCASCGQCRDCGICAAVCPQAAIERVAEADGGFRYQAAPERCIGCGFCAGACPCGIWTLAPNTPLA